MAVLVSMRTSTLVNMGNVGSSSSAKRPVVERNFSLSSIEQDRVSALHSEIRKLEGRPNCIHADVNVSTTHVIYGPKTATSRFERTAKVTSACAGGLWILKENYVTESSLAGYWLPEEDYEWSERDIPDSAEHQSDRKILRAFRFWRRRVTRGAEYRPFTDWKVLLCARPEEAKLRNAVAENLLVGGALIVKTVCSWNEVSSEWSSLQSHVTHVLYASISENDSVVLRNALASSGVQHGKAQTFMVNRVFEWPAQTNYNEPMSDEAIKNESHKQVAPSACQSRPEPAATNGVQESPTDPFSRVLDADSLSERDRQIEADYALALALSQADNADGPTSQVNGSETVRQATNRGRRINGRERHTVHLSDDESEVEAAASSTASNSGPSHKLSQSVATMREATSEASSVWKCTPCGYRTPVSEAEFRVSYPVLASAAESDDDPPSQQASANLRLCVDELHKLHASYRKSLDKRLAESAPRGRRRKNDDQLLFGPECVGEADLCRTALEGRFDALVGRFREELLVHSNRMLADLQATSDLRASRYESFRVDALLAACNRALLPCEAGSMRSVASVCTPKAKVHLPQRTLSEVWSTPQSSAKCVLNVCNSNKLCKLLQKASNAAEQEQSVQPDGDVSSSSSSDANQCNDNDTTKPKYSFGRHSKRISLELQSPQSSFADDSLHQRPDCDWKCLSLSVERCYLQALLRVLLTVVELDVCLALQNSLHTAVVLHNQGARAFGTFVIHRLLEPQKASAEFRELLPLLFKSDNATRNLLLGVLRCFFTATMLRAQCSQSSFARLCDSKDAYATYMRTVVQEADKSGRPMPLVSLLDEFPDLVQLHLCAVYLEHGFLHSACCVTRDCQHRLYSLLFRFQQAVLTQLAQVAEDTRLAARLDHLANSFADLQRSFACPTSCRRPVSPSSAIDVAVRLHEPLLVAVRLCVLLRRFAHAHSTAAAIADQVVKDERTNDDSDDCIIMDTAASSGQSVLTLSDDLKVLPIASNIAEADGSSQLLKMDQLFCDLHRTLFDLLSLQQLEEVADLRTDIAFALRSVMDALRLV